MKKITVILGALIVCALFASAQEKPEKPDGQAYVPFQAYAKQPVRSDKYKDDMGRPWNYAQKAKNNLFKEFNSKEEFIFFLHALKSDKNVYNKDTQKAFDAVYDAVSKSEAKPDSKTPQAPEEFYAFVDVDSFHDNWDNAVTTTSYVYVDPAVINKDINTGVPGFKVADNNIIKAEKAVLAELEKKAQEDIQKRMQMDLSTNPAWGGMR